MKTYEDDPLGGYDNLDPRQQAAVRRMSNRARRYENTGYVPTSRDRWAAFQRADMTWALQPRNTETEA